MIDGFHRAPRRDALLFAFGSFLVVALAAFLLIRMVTEAGGTNSFALVAQSLLKG